MNKYEMMFIVKATNEGAAVASVADEVKKTLTANNAKVSDFKEIGLKKLAYPIKKEINGYYYLATFTTEPSIIAEINRKTSINENVLRHLVIKLDEE